MQRFASAVVLAALALLAPASRGVAETIDGVAAQVGTDIVLLSDVLSMTEPIEERMRDAGAPEGEILRVRSTALDRLIDDKILAQMVRRLEMAASDEDVDRAIASIAADSGISVRQLERSVVGHGLSLVDYRRKIQTEIERSKIVNAMVRQRVRIEEADLRASYAARFEDQPTSGREVRVRHILVGFGEGPGRTPEEACAIAAQARARIEGGEVGFPRVASEVSDTNRESGGDLGWIHEREIARWMERALGPLEAEGVSDVVRTGFGCNLLQLVGRRDFQPMTFEQAAPMLHEELMRTRMEEEYARWINELRSQTFVERRGLFAEASRLSVGR